MKFLVIKKGNLKTFKKYTRLCTIKVKCEVKENFE